jgi:hypothetical protein
MPFLMSQRANAVTLKDRGRKASAPSLITISAAFPQQIGVVLRTVAVVSVPQQLPQLAAIVGIVERGASLVALP